MPSSAILVAESGCFAPGPLPTSGRGLAELHKRAATHPPYGALTLTVTVAGPPARLGAAAADLLQVAQVLLQVVLLHQNLVAELQYLALRAWVVIIYIRHRLCCRQPSQSLLLATAQMHHWRQLSPHPCSCSCSSSSSKQS